MKILVIKRDKLGDLLLATPMLAHLRARLPSAEIHLLANDYNAWVVDGNPDVDKRWVYRRVRNGNSVNLAAAMGLLAQNFSLRRARFDFVIVANGEDSPRATRRGLAIRGHRCIAYCNDPSAYPGLSDPLPVQRDQHEADRMMALLRPLGIPDPTSRLLPRYFLPAPSALFAQGWLSERNLTDKGFVVLGLGARRQKKQPSTSQILRWSERFKRQWNLETVFMWTPGKSDDPMYPGDDVTAQSVLDVGVPYVHPFRGPLKDALGLVWRARTSIFPDSGLMHFAAASPGGVLGLFAETDISPSPVQWAPRGVRTGYLEARTSVSELPDDEIYAAVACQLG